MNEIFHTALEIIALTSSWRGLVQSGWVIVLLVTALIWGRGPEKFVIVIWIVVHEVGNFVRQYEPASIGGSDMMPGVSIVYLTGDSLLLIGFVILALQANRQYILWIAAIQVIALLAHGVRASNDDVTAFVYLLMSIGAGWAQIGLMTGGQIANFRRNKEVFADWRWQVVRSGRGAASARSPAREEALATR